MENIKEKILSIAIAIILLLFIAYGINTFFPNPEYDDFCIERPYKVNITEEECVSDGGKYTLERVPKIAGEAEQRGYCDTTYTCRQELEDAREGYNRIVFIISGIIGLLCVVIGGIMLKVESVSAGIMGGGILTIIYGTIRYWGNLENVGRFLILGLILAVLIILGYKYIKK